MSEQIVGLDQTTDPGLDGLLDQDVHCLPYSQQFCDKHLTKVGPMVMGSTPG